MAATCRRDTRREHTTTSDPTREPLCKDGPFSAGHTRRAGRDGCRPFLGREEPRQVRAEDTRQLNTKGTLGWARAHRDTGGEVTGVLSAGPALIPVSWEPSEAQRNPVLFVQRAFKFKTPSKENGQSCTGRSDPEAPAAVQLGPALSPPSPGGPPIRLRETPQAAFGLGRSGTKTLTAHLGLRQAQEKHEAPDPEAVSSRPTVSAEVTQRENLGGAWAALSVV